MCECVLDQGRKEGWSELNHFGTAPDSILYLSAKNPNAIQTICVYVPKLKYMDLLGPWLADATLLVWTKYYSASG